MPEAGGRQGHGGRGAPAEAPPSARRWNVVGIQGSLLSIFVEPIYFSSIILGSLYHGDHLSRAMYQRISNIEDLPALYTLNKPLLSGKYPPSVSSPLRWTSCAGSRMREYKLPREAACGGATPEVGGYSGAWEGRSVRPLPGSPLAVRKGWAAGVWPSCKCALLSLQRLTDTM